MVLTKCFSLFGLSISLSKNIFIFKWNFKIVFPTVLTIVALYVTLKQVTFSQSFSRCNSENLIRTLTSKNFLKYWMLYSAIKGMCSISANGSIKSPQAVHYWAFLKSHHQNVWPRCERVTWKNCKLRNALEVDQKQTILMSKWTYL